MVVLDQICGIKTRFNNIKKLVNDDRLYRGLVLDNDMKVMIISDPTTQKNAAALDINVGGMTDPDKLPGLAHLCEHVVFSNSESHYKKKEFLSYLFEHNGVINASTCLDYTKFYFDIASEYFEEGLSRFADFFLKPCFEEPEVTLEINAIESEFEMRIENDDVRLDQLVRCSGDSSHVYAKFIIGDQEILGNKPKQLGINLREELIKFYNAWYSSNIMVLSILGKQSLDELENFVVNKFSEVLNRNVQPLIWTSTPFNENHYMYKWYILPLDDIKKLDILFPMPDLSHNDHYYSGPIDYICELINFEGNSSFISLIKKNNWVIKIRAEYKERIRRNGYTNFSLTMNLTEEGLKNIDNIILLLFEYIKMLRSQGPLEWFFNDCKQMKNVQMRFKDKIKPINYVKSITNKLQIHSFEECLCTERFSKWNPNVINLVLDNLVPQKIRIYVMAKDFKNITTETEQWFGTKYRKQKIPDDLINKWTNPSVNCKLELPVKNNFILESFDIKADVKNDIIEDYPVIIKEDPLMRVWFKQDNEFFLPKAYLIIQFFSPDLPTTSLTWNSSKIYVKLLKDSLDDLICDTNAAGLFYYLQQNSRGILLSIQGYDEKQKLLLDKILDKMINLSVDYELFESIKKKIVKKLKNFETQLPFTQAVTYRRTLLSLNQFTTAESLKVMSSVTIGKFKEFMKQFFKRIYVECLCYGNMTKNEALAIAKLIENKLTKDPIIGEQCRTTIPFSSIQSMSDRSIKLKDGCNFLYKVEDKINTLSSAVVYYQTGKRSTELDMNLKLLNQIIKQKSYDILRNKIQPGCIASSDIIQSAYEQGFLFILQREKHPNLLDEEIEAFLETMKDHLLNISDSVFDNHKLLLERSLLEKPKTMIAVSKKFWSEISRQEYNFERDYKEVNYLKTITKEQIFKFFENKLYNNSTKCKLAVHVLSTATHKTGFHNQDVNPNNLTKPVLITDINEFKASQLLYSLKLKC